MAILNEGQLFCQGGGQNTARIALRYKNYAHIYFETVSGALDQLCDYKLQVMYYFCQKLSRYMFFKLQNNIHFLLRDIPGTTEYRSPNFKISVLCFIYCMCLEEVWEPEEAEQAGAQRRQGAHQSHGGPDARPPAGRAHSGGGVISLVWSRILELKDQSCCTLGLSLGAKVNNTCRVSTVYGKLCEGGGY